jgi:hypothetical protein
MQPYFASHSIFLRDNHDELLQELLNFREHGTFKKDTLDALRWAIDDVWKPDVEQNEKGDWLPPAPVMEVDWETGQTFTAADFYEA